MSVGNEKIILAIDYDGTIVSDNFPHHGILKPNAKEMWSLPFK